MKFKTLFTYLFFAALLFSACSAIGQNSSLEGTAWHLVQIDNGTLVPGARVTIQFQDGQASGRSACNNYGGSYTFGSDGSFTTGSMMMTLMACMDNGLMELESAYMQALGTVTSAKLDGNVLVLLGDAGQLIFERDN